MPQIPFDCQTIDHVPLKYFCSQLLEAVGLSDTNAQLVADTLIEASLRGIDSHGVARLPHYLQRIQAGSINPRPTIKTKQVGPAVASIDGDHTLGQLVMHEAASLAINLANDAGAGWVAVRNSSHCGALAYYGLQIANAGMIGLVFTHVDPMVIPHGSRKPFCGTNPICLTAPYAPTDPGSDSDHNVVCLDMATSKVPWNTIANAAMEEVSIPGDWAVDMEGEATTDANRVAALRPFGGYKGSGLGFMIDVLCALLADAPYGPDIPKMYGDMSQHRQLGGLVGAIDIGRFVSLERFHERLSQMVTLWGALSPVEPGGKVLYPGELEFVTRQRRLREGIPVGLNLLNEFNSLAEGFRLEQLSTAN